MKPFATKCTLPQTAQIVVLNAEESSFWTLRGSSHLAGQVKSLNPKLLSTGEGRSPLKYITSVFLLDFEYFIKKNLASQLEFGFPFSENPNSCQEVKLLALKVPKSVAM